MLPRPRFVIEGVAEERVEDGGAAIILTLYNQIVNPAGEPTYTNPFVRIQSYREGETEEDHLGINRLRGQRLRVTIEIVEGGSLEDELRELPQHFDWPPTPEKK